LALLVSESIDLIISGKDKIEQLYITGGFARNQIFTKTLAKIYHDKSVFVSKIDNATALGAALVINDGFKEKIDLGLTEIA
jgi:sugar (pentulose or hexulose) kinase